MNVKLPPPAIPQLNTLTQILQNALSNAVSSREATGRLLLQSPGTTTTAPIVYALTISDAGILTTTLVTGKAPV